MRLPKVTLCMIVKNESHIIRDCLESVSKTIDRYDITDTGSDDGTQKIIKDFFEEKGIPGEHVFGATSVLQADDVRVLCKQPLQTARVGCLF